MTDDFVPLNRGDVTSSSLLVDVKLRKPLAWERLVHLYAPLVYSWCQRAGLPDADALDLGQEVFIAVWKNIHKYVRRPDATFRGWLRRITQHKIIDYRRREPVLQGNPDDPTQLYFDPSPEESSVEEDRSETSLLCRRALALIRPDFEEQTWRAFEGYVMNERQAADVAAELKISVNAVYLAKSRVLKRLRDEFADLIEM